jgi:site-specific recombinase XerD
MMRNKKIQQQLEAYLNWRFTKETANSYLYAIEKFLKHYPNAPQLTLTVIETYFAGLKKQKQSVGYRTVTLSGIKAYYEFLVEQEVIKQHPCRAYFISEKKPTGKNFGALFTPEEMETLFTLREERYQYMSNRNKAMIGLLVYQGLTSSELVNLKVSDVDLELGTVFTRGGKKTKQRTLGLKSKQNTHLIRYIENDRPNLISQPTKYLFVSIRGQQMSVDSLHAFISRMQGAFDKLMSPKNIRASVISNWVNEQKRPLEEVQIMAGHRYPSSTEKYVRGEVNEQREAVSNLHESIFLK